MGGQELLQTLEALIAEKRWGDAVSIATTALAGDPADARLAGLLAEARTGAEASRASQWAESYNNRGGVFLKKKKLEQAESDFREALRLAPNEPVYMNNLGLALHRLGRRKEAIEWFRKAATQDPTFATARNNLYASTRVYLWGGGALVLVLSILLHGAFAASRGGTSGRDGLLVAGGVLALLVPVLLVRYWLRKRSLDPIARNLYSAEGRRPRRQLDERTVVRLAGFLPLVAAFAAAVLTRQTQLATVSGILAILWLHRGWTVWRFATGWIQR